MRIINKSQESFKIVQEIAHVFHRHTYFKVHFFMRIAKNEHLG